VTDNRYLVTGGLGYIGSVVVEELVREGAQVVVVDNGLCGTTPSTDPRVQTVIADVRDPLCLDEVIAGVDGVIHLAGIVGDRACDMDHTFTWDTNYLATVYVANACKRAGVRRMVFASTCSNYGWSCGQAADVLSPLRPLSVYAESKVRAEHHLLAARDDEFSPCILRLATIFGVSPRMRFDLVVNVMTAHAVTRGQVQVHGGDQWRPFIHVRDAASGGPIGADRAGLRYIVVGLFRIIPFFGLFTLLDGLWPLWDPRRQALHDKIAGSVVVSAG